MPLHQSVKVMNRLISSILFLAVFVFCVSTGSGAVFTPRVEVVMGRFCMMNPRDSARRVNQKILGSNQMTRIQITPNANGTVNISCAFIMPGYSAWLEVVDGFGISAFWIDSKTRDYISFSQPLGNGGIQLETGQVTEEQQKELGNDLEKMPDVSKLQDSALTVWKAKNVWSLVFFLPPEGEEALRKVLMNSESQALDSLRKQFLNVLMLIQSRLETEEVTAQKTLQDLLEEGRRLIRDLDSDSFQTRRLADAKLRELGLVVILLAGEVDWSTLSPEAERRLSFIVQESNVVSNVDDALQLDVQGWLNSPRIWGAALKFGSNQQKKVAWEVLQKSFPDLYEKKLKAVELDLEADTNETQEKIQRIYEMVQEEQ